MQLGGPFLKLLQNQNSPFLVYLHSSNLARHSKEVFVTHLIHYLMFSTVTCLMFYLSHFFFKTCPQENLKSDLSSAYKWFITTFMEPLLTNSYWFLWDFSLSHWIFSCLQQIIDKKTHLPLPTTVIHTYFTYSWALTVITRLPFCIIVWLLLNHGWRR